jgi:hypothetical protein
LLALADWCRRFGGATQGGALCLANPKNGFPPVQAGPDPLPEVTGVLDQSRSGSAARGSVNVDSGTGLADGGAHQGGDA